MINKINYKPLGRYILLKVEKQTKSGLLIPSNIKQNTFSALEVVLVADGITHINVGDMVLTDGATAMYQWTIDGIDYYQAPEHCIIGIVLNGASIEPTPEDVKGLTELTLPKDPTGHYN